MPEQERTSPARGKSTNFDTQILSFLDDLRRESPVFQRRSRSEIVNMIIEDFAAQNGTPIDTNKETRQSA